MPRQFFSRLSALLFFAALVLKLQGITGCANIVPPAGGPRDSLPPVLLEANPPDSSTGFRSDRIQFTFDEFVDLQDVQNNLLFTPTFERNPEVSVRGKTVTVRFRDSLSPNTTYILNFGNALRDYNEGNVLRNFIYTFSTGAAIDSLEISGRVLMAETGKPDSTLIVVLHRDLSDSAIAKKRPDYIARVDANGNFRFHNLPAARFAVYALGEAGLSRRYLNPSQPFAFADTPVLSGSAAPLTLYAYRQQPKQTAASAPPRPLQKLAGERLQFSTNLSNQQLDLASPFIISFQAPLKTFDSTKISLSSDSTYRPVAFSALLDSQRKQLTFSANWQQATTYHLILQKDFAEDSAGRRLLKTDTLHFTTKANADYGRLLLRIRNFSAQGNPVLQFVQNDRVVNAYRLQGNSLVVERLQPGEYELRLLYDRNDNGRWDAGSFFSNKKQPEVVKPLERKLNIKASWDNEIEINI